MVENDFSLDRYIVTGAADRGSRLDPAKRASSSNVILVSSG
jgi:hypothetical protein